MKKILIPIIVTLFITACNSQPADRSSEQASADLSNALERYTEYLVQERPMFAMQVGRTPRSLPRLSYANTMAAAEFAQNLMADLEAIPADKLDHQQRLSRSMLERELQELIEQPKYYWLSFDVTAYRAGFIFSNLPGLLSAFDVRDRDDREHYLRIVADLERLLNDLRSKLAEQANMGIRLPKPAVPGTVGLYQGLRESLPHVVQMSSSVLAETDHEASHAFAAKIQAILHENVLPALENLIATLDADYIEAAPDSVGLWQYPGGRDYYRWLSRHYTTIDLSPQVIHQRGLQYMDELREGKAEIRRELGFNGSEQEFKQKLLNDERFYADSPDAVEATYRRYLSMIEPKLDDYFMLTPDAGYGVKRLNTAAEGSVTFGYYSVPTPSQPKGYYHYNGSKLNERNMIWAQALIYHELVPGHHFHLALQKENADLPAFRRYSLSNTAFNEGWANYAASLADEMGILTDPYDRYGWLLFDSFLTARLVVDTGLNYFGWSLEEARQYMAENTFESETQIESETLRYSTSIPAQALAYKLGLEKFWEIRKRMEDQLGEQFDIRKFHAAALGSGALPFPILEAHIESVMLGR